MIALLSRRSAAQRNGASDVRQSRALGRRALFALPVALPAAAVAAKIAPAALAHMPKPYVIGMDFGAGDSFSSVLSYNEAVRAFESWGPPLTVSPSCRFFSTRELAELCGASVDASDVDPPNAIDDRAMAWEG